MGQDISSHSSKKRSCNTSKVKLKRLQRLRNNYRKADVILVCNGQELPAHRAVLEASSPYFRKCVSSSIPNNKYEVQLPIESQVMETVLDFVYFHGESVTEMTELKEVVKILEAADYLQLETLFDTCCQKIKELSTVQDFPTVTILCKYEQESASRAFLEYFSYCKFAIFDNGLYKHYTYRTLVTLLDITCKENILSAKELLEYIDYWIKHNTLDRADCMDLISLSYKHGFHQKFIESVPIRSIVKGNPKLLMQKLQDLADPKMDVISGPDLKYTSADENAIKSVRIIQFRKQGDMNVFVQKSFPKPNQLVPEVFETVTLPFDLADDMRCVVHKNKIFVVTNTGLETEDGEMKYQCSRYSICKNRWKSMQEFTAWNAVDKIMIYDDKLLFVETAAEDQVLWIHFMPHTGKDHKPVLKCHVKNMVPNCPTTCFEMRDKTKSTFVIVPSQDSAFSQSETQISIVDNFLGFTYKELYFSFRCVNDEDKPTSTSYWPQMFHFVPQVKSCCLSYNITSDNTVRFGNKLYTFCEKYVHVFDLRNDTIITRNCGINMMANDVIYPVNQRGKPMLVVHRQDMSPEECCYKLWNFDENRVVSEVTMAKDSVWETLIVIE